MLTMPCQSVATSKDPSLISCSAARPIRPSRRSCPPQTRERIPSAHAPGSRNLLFSALHEVDERPLSDSWAKLPSYLFCLALQKTAPMQCMKVASCHSSKGDRSHRAHSLEQARFGILYPEYLLPSDSYALPSLAASFAELNSRWTPEYRQQSRDQ